MNKTNQATLELKDLELEQLKNEYEYDLTILSYDGDAHFRDYDKNEIDRMNRLIECYFDLIKEYKRLSEWYERTKKERNVLLGGSDYGYR